MILLGLSHTLDIHIYKSSVVIQFELAKSLVHACMHTLDCMHSQYCILYKRQILKQIFQYIESI